MDAKFRLLSILTIMILLITACTTATETPSGVTEPTEAGPPMEEIVVKIGIVDPCGEVNSLDPINQPGAECSVMVNQIYNRLVDMDSNFQIHPELAYEWEANADKTEWTFYLTEGVKFHDGHELTCNDVVWTYQRLLDPQAVGDSTPHSENAPQLAFLNFDGIMCGDNDYEVKFVVDNPVPELPLQISIKGTWIVSDGAVHDDLHDKSNGTGPFMAVDFEPVQQPHVFVRNPDYWEEGLPKADRLEFYLIPEATTRAAALQSGEVDLVQVVDFASIPSLEADPNVELIVGGASTTMLAIMWIDTPPFDNPDVRNALKMVIDPQKVVDICWQGYGVAGSHNPIEPTSPYAYTDETPGQDIEGATELLTGAGYSADNPLTTDLYVAEMFPGFTCFAQMIAEEASKTGVAEINVIKSPESEYWDEVWLKQPFMISAHVHRHPAAAIPMSFDCDSQYPETHWCDPQFDDLLHSALSEPDDAARLQKYQELEEWITEEGGDIFEGHVYTVAAIRSNCSGYTPHAQISRFDSRELYCEP